MNNMKGTILLLFLCSFINIKSAAQKKCELRMKVRKTNSCLGVELPNLNVLYLGIENFIHVAYSGNCKLLVKIDNGVVVEKGEGNYVILVLQGKEAIISIYEKRDKKLDLIGSKNYRIKAVPVPTVLFAGKKNGEELSKIDLLIGGGLSINNDDFLYDIKYEIVSYQLSTNMGGEFKSESTEGSILSNGQYALMSKLKFNSRLIIEDIVVRQVGLENSKIKLPSIMLKVTGKTN